MSRTRVSYRGLAKEILDEANKSLVSIGDPTIDETWDTENKNEVQVSLQVIRALAETMLEKGAL